MVKFADRLSNLSRMDDWPGDKQLAYLEMSKFWSSEPPINDDAISGKT